MPTDTQRAPTLTQCIEREREAEDYATPPHPGNENCDTCAAVRAARAATDEAVRDLTRWAHELIDAADAMADRLALPQAVQDELDSIALAIGRVLPAPTAQGESTGGELT